jgi:prophage maintenance system killer protein
MPTILNSSQTRFLNSPEVVATHRQRLDIAASMGAQTATNRTVIATLNEAEVEAVRRMSEELQVDMYELSAHYTFNKYR